MIVPSVGSVAKWIRHSRVAQSNIAQTTKAVFRIIAAHVLREHDNVCIQTPYLIEQLIGQGLRQRLMPQIECCQTHH